MSHLYALLAKGLETRTVFTVARDVFSGSLYSWLLWLGHDVVGPSHMAGEDRQHRSTGRPSTS